MKKLFVICLMLFAYSSGIGQAQQPVKPAAVIPAGPG